MGPRSGIMRLAAIAARLYRQNIRIFAGSALMVTILQALEVANAPAALIIPIFIALWPMITGVLSRAVAMAYLGQPAQSVQQVYESIGWRRFLLLALANVIVTCAVVIGLALLVIPGLYLWVRFQFVPQVIVLEGASLSGALKRSSELVRGRWWQVFRALAAVYLAAGAVNAAVFVLVAAGSGALGLSAGSAAVALVIALTVLWALMDPMFFGTLYLLYFQLSRSEAVRPASGAVGART